MRKQISALDLKAKLFRGLADLSRLSILEALTSGPGNVSRIVRETRLSQSNASMHLECLWCCGLVDRKAQGRFMIYRLKSPRIRRVLKAAQEALGEVQGRIDECRRYDK